MNPSERVGEAQRDEPSGVQSGGAGQATPPASRPDPGSGEVSASGPPNPPSVGGREGRGTTVALEQTNSPAITPPGAGRLRGSCQSPRETQQGNAA